VKTKTFRADTNTAQHLTVTSVFRDLVTHPVENLIVRWNWKAALTSVIMRGSIFFTANLSAGLDAALAVLLTEFVFRTFTSGFYGAVLQAFRRVEPAWKAALTTMILLPAANHTAEFLIHWMRGTPKLAASIAASVIFTVLSTLFNLYIMRKGALLVGEHSNSLWHDMKQMPRLLAGFIAVGPLAVYRAVLKSRPRR
jgi:hypothetical protein